MEPTQITKEEWIRLAHEAVSQFDVATANRLIRGWKSVHGSLASDKQSEGRLEALRQNLLFTAFPLLTTELASLVLQEYLVAFLQSEEELMDPIEKIELRIKAAEYGLYDQERESMKNAILANNEVVGGMTLGEWVRRFENSAQSKEDDRDVVKNFLTKDSQMANLGKDDQAILRTLFFMYESWLRVPVISIFDLAVMVEGATGRTLPRSGSPKGIGGQSSVVKLPLLQALSKYEQLGNQLITQGRIKLKSQPETVRPSLLYWIKYYRDELGVGHHSSVERGNFLFRSENGKKLTPEERERVNLVLKSVEENYPVEVDTEQNVVIFPPFVPQGAPQPLPVPPLAPQKTAPQPRITFQPSRPTNLTAPQEGGLTFTTNHVMPGEREENRGAAPGATTARPVRSSTPAPKANPFHIRPVSMGKEE